MKNYYQILGLTTTATQDEIRKAYLKKAKEFHPDINKSSIAEAKFKEIQEAYNTLSDTGKKSSYDYNRQYQYHNTQQSQQNATEWAEYFRKEAERQRYNQQNPQQTPPKNNKDEFNFENYDDEINNQSTLFVILAFLAFFLLIVVIYYVGFWSSLVFGGMLYLLYQIYQGSKNTS